jgi:hypothetical protein
MLGTLFLFLIVILLLLGIIFFFTPQPAENKKNVEETTNWEYQKEQSKRETEAEKNKEWFSAKRWLTDKEIDWACQRIKTNAMPGSFSGQELGRFKILPAHQFHYVRETKGTAEANAHLAFPELLNELTSFSGKLIFIPVNNPNFHWSLLVYETTTNKFYHYDTLQGANYEYVEPLVKELLSQIQQTNQPDLNQFLVKRHNIKQGNGYDCGVAVISIIKRIRKKYQSNLAEIELGGFDFPKERQTLRSQYLSENGED